MQPETNYQGNVINGKIYKMYFIPANSLSASGYHLCVRNETRTVTFLAMHKVPYTVKKPCGGWLLWKTCTVTLYRMTHQIEYKTVMEQVTRCCDGYVQVGRYCALRESIKDHILFCLLSDFKSVCTSVFKIWWYSYRSHQRDLAVCGAVHKIRDGSRETAHTNISLLMYT